MSTEVNANALICRYRVVLSYLGACCCGLWEVNWGRLVVQAPVHSRWQFTTALSTWCLTPRRTHTWSAACFSLSRGVMLTQVCVCVCERGINPQQQRFRFFFLMSQIMKVIEKGNIAHDRRTEIEFKRSVKAVAKKKKKVVL